jgi:peptidyl-prolyl cis-trans isomerase D
MIGAEGKGLFVYVKEKKLPDLSPANPQYAMTQAQLAMLTSRTAADQYLAELVAREMKKSQPAAAPAK